MNVKEFANAVGLNYDKARYMIQHDMFSFIKAIKNNKKYSYYFEPIETIKYIKEYIKNNDKFSD